MNALPTNGRVRFWTNGRLLVWGEAPRAAGPMPRSPAGFNGSIRSRALLLLALLATAACSARRTSLPPPASPSSSAAPPPSRADAFREALTALAAHDAASDWTD